MNILIRKIKEMLDNCKISLHINSDEKNDVVHKEQLLKDNKYENVFTKLSSVKFGVEIEFQVTEKDVNGEDILEEFEKNGVLFEQELIMGRGGKRHYQNWQLMKETSCDWEIISPVLRNISEDWEILERVCNVLQNSQYGIYVDDNCAIHIHIDRKSVLSCGQQYINLMNMYRYLEPLIYGISVGEDNGISLKRVKKYAATLAYADKELKCNLGCEDFLDNNIRRGNIDFVNNYYKTRLLGLNFMTGNTENKTIEFRTFNGTLDSSYIKFYLAFVFNLVYISILKDDFELTKIKFWEISGGEYKYSDNYINKCMVLLNPDDYLKKWIYKILTNIDYNIPCELFEPLNGNYLDEDSKNFISSRV